LNWEKPHFFNCLSRTALANRPAIQATIVRAVLFVVVGSTPNGGALQARSTAICSLYRDAGIFFHADFVVVMPCL
jgi:hypothetical protein